MYCLHRKEGYFDIRVHFDPYRGGLHPPFFHQNIPLSLVSLSLLHFILLSPTHLPLFPSTFPLILLCYYFHITRFLLS
jgi:hypothetical protein